MENKKYGDEQLIQAMVFLQEEEKEPQNNENQEVSEDERD